MSLILRSAKAFPLTNTELDGNFTYLSSQINTKLNITDFTSTSVLLKITTGPQGESSGIDASKVRGLIPSDQSVANTIVTRDVNGDFQAREIFVNLIHGKSTECVRADTADTALTLTNTLPINKGGTSATTAATARVALGAVNIAGDILTGKLKFCATTTAISSLNIPKTLFIPTSPVEGDMWHSASGLNISTGGVKKTFAFLDSDITGTAANVTGIVAIANGGTGSNTKDTARVALGAAKAGANTDITSLSSPELGSATATTQIATDSSNKVATTAFITNRLTSITSISGTAGNVTGIVAIANGGTGSNTKDTARVALGAAKSGANTDISSLSSPELGSATAVTQSTSDNSTKIATTAFVTNKISATNTTGTAANVTGIISIANGGTGSNTKDTARDALGAAKSGANIDITSLSSPSLGSATAVTQIATDSSTKVATTAFVTSKWSTLNANGNYVVNSLSAKSLGMNDLTFINLIQEGAGDGAYPEIMMGRFGKPCNAPFEFWTSGHTPSNGSWDSLISASGGNGTNGSGNISIVGNLNVSGNVNGVNLSNLTINAFGSNQSYQNVTTSRTFGTTYTNTTSKTIWVNARVSSIGEIIEDYYIWSIGFVNGVEITRDTAFRYGPSWMTLQFFVPAGSTYYVNIYSVDEPVNHMSGGQKIEHWVEYK